MALHKPRVMYGEVVETAGSEKATQGPKGNKRPRQCPSTLSASSGQKPRDELPFLPQQMAKVIVANAHSPTGLSPAAADLALRSYTSRIRATGNAQGDRRKQGVAELLGPARRTYKLVLEPGASLAPATGTIRIINGITVVDS